MIQLKNSAQISAMLEAGRITGEALLLAREHVREGVSTKELDTVIRNHIEKCGARPSFLGYSGFPASACISVNDEVIHGIPSKDRILVEGDIVKIDVGAFYKGFHGDSARTIAVGNVSDEAAKLIRVTRDSFFAGVAAVKAGNRIGDVGSAIQGVVEGAGRGVRLCSGMTLAIEPMVNVGGEEVYELPDGWTVKTKDGSLSAHYENTIALTSEGVIITTLVDKEW